MVTGQLQESSSIPLERGDGHGLARCVVDYVSVRISFEIGSERERAAEVGSIQILDANGVRAIAEFQYMLLVGECKVVGEFQVAVCIVAEERTLVSAGRERIKDRDRRRVAQRSRARVASAQFHSYLVHRSFRREIGRASCRERVTISWSD